MGYVERSSAVVRGVWRGGGVRSLSMLVVLAGVTMGLGMRDAAGAAREDAATVEPLLRVVDLDVDERQTVTLADGSQVTVRLLEVDERTEPVRGSVERATVRVEVDGEPVELEAGLYNLPVRAGAVQIDSPVTGGYNAISHRDHWALETDARLRLWPADSAWIRPGSFVYPLRQRWMASATWYSNEPIVVELPEPDREPSIYYHAGMDMGGADGLDEIVAATDGLILSLGEEVMEDVEHPGRPRYDVVYLRDERGWVYRYSHLDRFDDDLAVAQRVTAGQRLGWLGKEGASGGWAHLHFHILAKQPSGRWGMQDAYAFFHQAYRAEHDPAVMAVARPRRVTVVGRPVTVDARRSWAKAGIASFEWSFTDGTTAEGAKVERTYDEPGHYVETVKVTDTHGHVDYDFATVRVFDVEAGVRPPNLHAAFHPTRGIDPGDEIHFKVRAFRADGEGEDVWDFGDGSDPVTVRSGTSDHRQAPEGEGYVTVTHRYEQPGHYLVSVRRETPNGVATDRLYVPVGVAP